MANTAKNAILRALVEGAVADLMVKTNVDNVYVDDTTTLAAKLAELITSLNGKATTAQLTALKQELLGDVPVEAYNTFTELAAYIESHEEAADALTAAIGSKADATTVANIQATIAGLGTLAKLNEVSESNLSSALLAKVNAASEGNHSHSNKTVLDGITADTVTAWNNKANFYVAASQPSDLSANDLWIQIVD